MTVFIVQDQHHHTQDGTRKPKFDFSPAREFGELHCLLKPNTTPFDTEYVLKRLHSALHRFDDDDFLLLTGNPVLLGMSVAVAAHYNDGNVRLLQWNVTKQSYTPISVEDIFGEFE